MNFIKFKPIYKELVWGGDILKNRFGRNIDSDKPIGESWEISDRTDACSIVVGGRFDGKSIREAILEDSEYVMGKSWDKNLSFPILVKWIDASQDLSVQVHPRSNGVSKNENWYISDCSNSARLIAGLKKGITKEKFATAVSEKKVESLLLETKVEKGDSVYIPSGLIHSIGAGNLILEIQQNCDTTYRIFDWNRVGLDGNPRQLHIEESLREIDFEISTPKFFKTIGKNMEICNCNEFVIHTINMKAGDILKIPANQMARILSLVEGELISDCGNSILLSENVILPYAQTQILKAAKNSTILLTEKFS